MLKKLIILIIILFSSSFIYLGNSFSSATIENSALIKIVNSEDALIAIPSSLSLESNISKKATIDNTIADKDAINNSISNKETIDNSKAVAKTIKTKIKNNINEKIWVKVDDGNITSTETFADPDFGLPIDAGQEIAVTINLKSVYKGKDVVFHARWHGNACSAEIRSSITG